MEQTIVIDQIIRNFISKGMALHRVHQLDEVYSINRLLTLLKKADFDVSVTPSIPLPSILDSRDLLVQYAVDQNLIPDTPIAREEFEAEVMAIASPLPSVLNRDFWNHYQEAPMRATDEFYQLSKDMNYIKTRRLERNIHFSAASPYGKLKLTINMARPEQAVEEEAAAFRTRTYPLCPLCAENEGYHGHSGITALANHRVVRVPLQGQNWGFQYSPYAFFAEHCIVFNRKHRPLELNEKAVGNLLELVSIFPHYFFGTNDVLPRMGGRLHIHEHYQGGRAAMPIEGARAAAFWQWPDKEGVTVETLRWPVSVVRLRSEEPEKLKQAACQLIGSWLEYSDEAAGILDRTTEPHNGVTLLARRKYTAYELDVALRNNRTDAAHPNGIFFPGENVRHLKRDAVGLFEVAGMSILPGRLEEELREVKAYLLGEENQITACHLPWAQEMAARHEVTSENAENIIREEVGRKFTQALEDSGVFKQSAEGEAAFRRFLTHAGLKAE